MVDYIGNGPLRDEALLIDCMFRKVRFDDFHFAEMSSTVALIAQARVLAMM